MALNHLAQQALRFGWARNMLRGIVLSMLLVAATAQAASYVYDANGRLRAVTSSTGASSEYIYDALGNLYAINSVAASQLSVFAFTPNHGPVGLPVTIFGKGFSTTQTANTVKFSGTPATVTSATATQLGVTVPSGAVTGPISVQVGSTTATSLDNFIVTSDSGGQPPTIASFSPTLASSGTAITVNGSHYVTTAGSTWAGVGSNAVVVTPISDTQLTFSVSPFAGSGPIAITTPYGEAQSSQALIVVPSVVGGVSNVVATGSLTIGGAAQSINLSAANKYGAVTFQGISGQWLTLQFNQFSDQTAFLYASVYDQNNAIVLSTKVLSPAMLSLHLPQLPRTGTYLVLMQASKAGQFPVALESNPVLSTTTATTVSTTVAGQSKRAIFNGLLGQNVGVAVTNPVTTPSAGMVNVAVYDLSYPEGYSGYYGTDTNSSATAFFVNAPPKTESSSDTVIVGADQSHSISAQLTAMVNPTAALTVDGSAKSLTTTVSGENAYLSFGGTVGQYLSLGITNLSSNPSGPIYIKVYKPDGSPVDPYNIGFYCSPPGCHYALDNLTETGTYFFRVFPSYSAQSGTMSFSATLSSDVMGTLVANTAKAVSLAKPGQVARMTFSGTAGQRAGLYLGNVATTPTGHSVALTVYNPNGSVTSGANLTSTTNANVLLGSLTQTENYTVLVEPQGGDTANVQLTYLTSTNVAVSGASTNIPTTAPGENTYLKFDGTAGQNLTFVLSNLVYSPPGVVIFYEIYKPDGYPWDLYNGGTNCSSPGCNYPLANLPATGTYTVVVQPTYNYQSTQTMSFSASVTSP